MESSTQSPDSLIHNVSQQSSESPQPQPDESSSHATGSRPETARLSCDNCRRRKVKCDRGLPACSLCAKLKHACIYSVARKKPVRRMKYMELEERLESMERVLVDRKPSDAGSDFQTQPSLNDQRHFSIPMDDLAISHSQIVLSRPPGTEQCYEWDFPEGGILDDSSSSNVSFNPRPDPATFTRGSIPLFTSRGTQWVDQLVGDSSFSNMVHDLKPPDSVLAQTMGLLTPPANLLPSHNLAETCLQGFFATINIETTIFQADMMFAALQNHQEGNKILETSYIAAINIVIAFQKHNCFQIKYKIDSDLFLQNALSLIPRLLIEGPDTMGVGALICIVLYFHLASEIEFAASILGCATQVMINAGYNLEKKPDDVNGLLQNQLFWQATILASDFSLQLCRAPFINDSTLVCLPPRNPVDGRGNVTCYDGTVINITYERVTLAKLQRKVHALLFSSEAAKQNPQQTYATVIELDHELAVFKARLPAITGKEMYDARFEGALVYLTVIYLRYYQLVIAVHSAVFTRPSGRDAQVRRKKAAPSIALCVQAARDIASLPDKLPKDHPFMKFLVPNVALNVDILCLNILQNKNTVMAYQDLALMEKVVKQFERFSSELGHNIISHTANLLYLVAAHGIRRPKAIIAQPATQQPPPQQLRNMDAWNDPNFVCTELPANPNIYHPFQPDPGLAEFPNQPFPDHAHQDMAPMGGQMGEGAGGFLGPPATSSADIQWHVPAAGYNAAADGQAGGISFYISNP
ncbi:uncharacterized protein L3040_009524 [Drepanopeziza brunnea f. sp. 'multigermtubi']|uniref:uncharacterized protein n=1 Tax=Drepanopeziza brunnea f. sp. 'multigermtubi' TaxID=698441 RepID=UPI00238CB15C|nr:hypothetical protein L3040_009524 [Drepanopeziza brunnea f. sp. 'multigermtubi']